MWLISYQMSSLAVTGGFGYGSNGENPWGPQVAGSIFSFTNSFRYPVFLTQSHWMFWISWVELFGLSWRWLSLLGDVLGQLFGGLFMVPNSEVCEKFVFCSSGFVCFWGFGKFLGGALVKRHFLLSIGFWATPKCGILDGRLCGELCFCWMIFFYISWILVGL